MVEPARTRGEQRNHQEIVTLRDYVDTRLASVVDTMKATEASLAIRLEAMNEFRAQINAERGDYIQRVYVEAMRSEHDGVHKAIESDIRSLRESRSEIAGKASISAVYFSMICVVVSLIVSVASLVRSFY